MQEQFKMAPGLVIVMLSAALLVGACGKGGAPQAGAPGGPGMPEVGVMVAQTERVALSTELSGRAAPYLIAEVRPQVGGIVKERPFREGSEVKAGELLYLIDPAPYQASYDGARAALARAEANLEVARLKAERHAELVKIDAVSKQAHDDAQAALKQAEADVLSARAVADKARIDLDYTRVKSPIAGRVGRSGVTPGALVKAAQDESLATVQQLDPIYIDVTQSSAELLKLRREIDAGRMQKGGAEAVKVKLLLEDGSTYPLEGKLAFSEVSVDQGTGSVTLRAIFPNPKQQLLPGMYVRAVVEQGLRDNVVLVPHKGVSRDARGNATVMVVNADNKVEARVVKTDRVVGDKWAVTEGLATGDRVILEGLQKIRPGAEVKVADAAAAPAAPAAAQPAR